MSLNKYSFLNNAPPWQLIKILFKKIKLKKIFIFFRLSTKAAIAASTSATTNNNNNINNYQLAQFAALCSAQQQQNFEFDIKKIQNNLNQTKTSSANDGNNNKNLINVETQTDQLMNNEIRLSSCIATSNKTPNNCGCRIIKVCCCGEETCLRNARIGGASSVWNIFYFF